MLAVQKLIEDVGFDEAMKFLAEELHIVVKDYDNHVVLNYNQIFSPETDPYVMECRGLILDKEGQVAGRRWNRFFNYGQQPDITGKFVFDGATIYEKVDGSTILVWYNRFDMRWEISTRGTAFAESEQMFYPTFRQAVLEDGFGVTEEQFQEYFRYNFDIDYSFVFEYCSLKNRIVTVYQEPVMYLISVIENHSGEEYHDAGVADLAYGMNVHFSQNVQPIARYDFDSMESLLDTAKNLGDLKEGYVAKDVNGLRIKIKADLYLKVHRIKGEGQLTPKAIASLVAQNEQDEFLAYFPEYRDMFVPIELAAKNLLQDMVHVYNKHKHHESQKDFALAVKDYPFSAVMFTLRKTDKDVTEVWDELREQYKIDMILAYVKE